jgi:hypothetical protein
MQQRPNGIPESWNIEATKNNFVLNKYNIKDNNKIENDFKNNEIKKSVTFKSQYAPNSWNLYATNIQTNNSPEIFNNQQQRRNIQQIYNSTEHNKMTNILRLNTPIKREERQNIRIQQKHREQHIERYLKKHKKDNIPQERLISDALRKYKPITNKSNVLDRIELKKEARAQQKLLSQQKAPEEKKQIQAYKQFIEPEPMQQIIQQEPQKISVLERIKQKKEARAQERAQLPPKPQTQPQPQTIQKFIE